jgi:hypothetical protein
MHSFFVDLRVWRVAIGAEHAAIARLGLEQRPNSLTATIAKCSGDSAPSFPVLDMLATPGRGYVKKSA